MADRQLYGHLKQKAQVNIRWGEDINWLPHCNRYNHLYIREENLEEGHYLREVDI